MRKQKKVTAAEAAAREARTLEYASTGELDADLLSYGAALFITDEYKVATDYLTVSRGELDNHQRAVLSIIENRAEAAGINFGEYVSNLMEEYNAIAGTKIFCWEPKDSINAIKRYFGEADSAPVSAPQIAEADSADLVDFDIDAFGILTPEEAAERDAREAAERAEAERRAALPKIAIVNFAFTVTELPYEVDPADFEDD